MGVRSWVVKSTLLPFLLPLPDLMSRTCCYVWCKVPTFSFILLYFGGLHVLILTLVWLFSHLLSSLILSFKSAYQMPSCFQSCSCFLWVQRAGDLFRVSEYSMKVKQFSSIIWQPLPSKWFEKFWGLEKVSQGVHGIKRNNCACLNLCLNWTELKFMLKVNR